MRTIHIGLSDKERQGSCELLNVTVANESLLLIKTKKFHWDVVGPQFMTLHKMWDEQYEKIAILADEAAERVRQLGGFPIGTAAGFLEKATIREQPGDIPSATDAVVALLFDHEAIARTLRESIADAQEKFNDAGTADFLTKVIQVHEQMAWMLRSFVEGFPVLTDGKLTDASGKVNTKTRPAQA